MNVLGCAYKERMAVEKRYKIPLGTKVEIISGCSDNGRIGTLGAKDPDGLSAHKVIFENGEFDIFMDDEFIPIQNIITIDNLEYGTLCEVFNHEHLYETDRVIVKQRKFTYDDIHGALLRVMNVLSEEFEERKYKDKCGKVIDLLISMISYDEDDLTPIQEILLFEQWWIRGLRGDCKSSKGRKPRYFNSEAKIEIMFI